MKFVAACIDEIPDGGRLIKVIGGRSIGIFNVDGTHYAIRNRCPHQGAPLCEGRIEPRVDSPEPGTFDVKRDTPVLRCPWHGWEFDMHTGESWFDPRGTRIRSYETTVVEGARLADRPPARHKCGDLAAETYPVSTEAKYLLVELDNDPPRDVRTRR
jgi:3-phenylpropionate/trans-cinnamate dioxygenase ferredoxin subunit